MGDSSWNFRTKQNEASLFVRRTGFLPHVFLAFEPIVDSRFAGLRVLVDGGTVSAAELFAAVLRDEAGALIVGSQTFGKGVMQNTYEFSDGSALTLSVGKIYTKSGTWNETGLKPDYSVELAGGAVPGNISDDADSQLQKAIEVLTPKIAAELQ